MLLKFSKNTYSGIQINTEHILNNPIRVSIYQMLHTHIHYTHTHNTHMHAYTQHTHTRIYTRYTQSHTTHTQFWLLPCSLWDVQMIVRLPFNMWCVQMAGLCRKVYDAKTRRRREAMFLVELSVVELLVSSLIHWGGTFLSAYCFLVGSVLIHRGYVYCNYDGSLALQ